ncbi:nectin-4-like isoform X1 [Carassius auratus]|uniref:Nectin-4-like isoform X1 n=2 Tax=Carassius auratus TaxID=7957 RepID=A0A6P6PMW1_CARAU|nr:nectin-4-like isoform X1 [Carassius auratus]
MKTVSYFLAALIIWNSAACVSGEQEHFLEPSESPWTLQCLAEEETRLPCRFDASNSNVVQVIWIRLDSNGGEEQVITAHQKDGQNESPAYRGRARFATSNPIEDSALILMGTRSADEGKYICKIATFPNGNFQTEILVTVWTKPITSLQPFVLVEGESFRPAAVCRSVAKPMAGLSWDTELAGQSQNRSLDSEVASIQFSLHPLRNMNGQKLDCLVWHPSQKGPVRISNNLVVHYPPNALISGYEDDWYAEMQEATLQCSGQGNPEPQRFSWMRKDEALPEGVTMEGGTLRFSRPLSLTDQGVYVCTATNEVGSGKAEILINISDLPPKKASVNYVMMIIIAGVAAVIVLTLIIVIISVKRYYKRKNQQLAIELVAKKEEISTLSRQASIRRVNSGSNRYSDDNNPLRAEGTIRTSLSSLDRPRSRDSRSTLGGVDSLGRPAIYNTSRRGRDKIMDRTEKETRLMMESYEQDSNLSQETQLLPPLHPSSYSMEQAVEIVRSRNGSAILPAEGRPQSGGSTRGGSRGHNSPLVSMYPTLTDEEEEDSVSPTDSGVHRGLMEPDGFENGGSDISEALSSHFERTNGILWPKSKPNNTLLPAKTKLFLPHSPTIHKAQIV